MSKSKSSKRVKFNPSGGGGREELSPISNLSNNLLPLQLHRPWRPPVTVDIQTVEPQSYIRARIYVYNYIYIYINTYIYIYILHYQRKKTTISTMNRDRNRTTRGRVSETVLASVTTFVILHLRVSLYPPPPPPPPLWILLEERSRANRFFKPEEGNETCSSLSLSLPNRSIVILLSSIVIELLHSTLSFVLRESVVRLARAANAKRVEKRVIVMSGRSHGQ